MERVSALMGSRLFASVIPVTAGVLGVLIANLPVSFLGGIVPAPLLGLMPIYFWGLVRPDLMPPFWAFAAGILEDMLSGGPAGVWTVSFIVTYVLIDRQRDAFAGLSGFGAILGFATAASLACASAYNGGSALLLAHPALRAGDGRTRDEHRLLCPGAGVPRLRAPPAGRSLAERFLMPLFDRKDKSRYATFTRRTLMVSGGMTAVLCALGGGLYQLQIRDGALYRTAAEDNRVNERLVAPPRGRILDRSASSSPTTAATTAFSSSPSR